MLKALDKHGQPVMGFQACKKEQYYCPSCKESLILKKGAIKVHHFAHVAESECKYDLSETENHLYMKQFLYQYFLNKPFIKHIETEHRLGELIADVYLVTQEGNRVVIECQCSPIELREFQSRTVRYSRQGIYTLWLFSNNLTLEENISRLSNTGQKTIEYKTNEVERKSHIWNFGRVYYFFRDKIYAVHFEKISQYVPDSCQICLKSEKCLYRQRNPNQCPIYQKGYFKQLKNKRTISVKRLNAYGLLCVDHKSGIKIARLYDRKWW